MTSRALLRVARRSSSIAQTFSLYVTRHSRFSTATGSSVDAVASPAVSVNIPVEPTPSALTPRQVVAELDRHIVGQPDAKRAVAIALRNRYRRHKLNDALRAEVSPKNILLIGPTGVGKTEIARRLAKLCDAPFVKVEATKYTEVGFHGKDVDEMIKDLIDASLRLLKQRRRKQIRQQVAPTVENRLVDILVGDSASETTKRDMLQCLRAGGLEHVIVRVPVPVGPRPANPEDAPDMPEGLSNGGIIAISRVPSSLARGNSLLNALGLQGGANAAGARRTTDKHLPVSEAREILMDAELDKALNNEDLTREAIRLAENDGIVVIDEIDKVCSPKGARDGKDASAEGVQRDLLPLVEGSIVSTKYGNVDTTHILFIASGAFSACKPSDMLPELQGRLPIRVELKPLTQADMQRILTEPEHNLLAQQRALLATEQLKVEFDADAVTEIARVAVEANAAAENIGARRLHAVVERLMEELSFDASEKEPGTVILIDREFVQKRVSSMIKNADLSRYVL